MENYEVIKYFAWYCSNVMSFQKMKEFYNTICDVYISEKWNKFQRSHTAWFMDLDNSHRKRFIDIAIEHYTT